MAPALLVIQPCRHAAPEVLDHPVLLGVSLPVSAQWLLFAALSIGMLVLFRARLREKIKTREQDVDKLEDEIAVATEQLAAGGTGTG